MMRTRLILPLVMACVLSPAIQARAQDEDILAREDDVSAITAEERRRALTALSSAADQSRGAGEMLRAARLLNRAGRLQLQLNLKREALATYQDALAILKRAPDQSTSVDSLDGLGEAYGSLSRCDEAQTFLRRAIALSEQGGYVAGKAEALLTLSNCQNNGDHALALSTALEALELWQSVNIKRGVARSYAAISYYQLARDNLTEAAQSGEAALSLWRELGAADGQADALISLGFIEYRRGAWQNVFTLLTQAQDLLDEEAEPYKMGQISAGLAEAFIESGLPETGLAKYRQALEYYRQAQSLDGEAAMVLGVGRSHFVLGDYPEALADLQR